MNGHTSVTFPVCIASIDVGSNALRFLAAEFYNSGQYNELASDRYQLRLGHTVFLSGKISGEAIESAVKGLKQFSEKIRELDIRHHRAVATSAVRESKNGEELVERVLDETGIELEKISGSEEARLIHRAVKNRVEFGDAQWIIADLGGGSVEVSLVDAEGILWSESHTMGSVRLLEELSVSGQEPGRFDKLLTEYISTLKVPSAVQTQTPAGFIGTGGNIETLGKLGGETDENGLIRLSVRNLNTLIKKLAGLSYHERMRELDLREDRADVILPAGLVFERIAGLIGVDEIIIPGVGLREGVALDLVDGLQSHEHTWERQTYESAVNLGRKYMFDEQHALQVAKLAISLFDQLYEVHRLGEKDRQILYAAAILHDIGTFISLNKHHKHSLYIISQSELPGFSPVEMLMIANVARYHRKSEPQLRHSTFAQLDEGQRERVERLSSILRMADAMDREHLKKVEDVNVSVLGREVVLKVNGSDELLLERWTLQKKSQYFGEKFGVHVKLKIEGQ
jgi:exopolyphosphatase/guanosine-5'-triphosphate,3'-diphosphate pyrophosphatase